MEISSFSVFSVQRFRGSGFRGSDVPEYSVPKLNNFLCSKNYK
jgi:hypothetical protein